MGNFEKIKVNGLHFWTINRFFLLIFGLFLTIFPYPQSIFATAEPLFIPVLHHQQRQLPLQANNSLRSQIVTVNPSILLQNRAETPLQIILFDDVSLTIEQSRLDKIDQSNKRLPRKKSSALTAQ